MEARQVDLLVEAEGDAAPRYSLKVTLVNRSAEAFTIYRHSLPWVGWNSMLLVAVKTDAVGSILEKNSPIDDPGPETVTIQPGQVLKGDILLESRFPMFAESLKSRDVIVFWSYQCTPIAGAPSARTGGYVLFTRISAG